jgi:hypothetical protein
MTAQSLFKVLKPLLMFIVLMNVYSIQQVSACCNCLPPCPENICCHHSCCKSTSSLEIAPGDILKYSQTGTHPAWKVIRKPEKALVPAHVGEIKVGKVQNRGDGSIIVNYTVRGIPQQAIIQHK